MTTHKQIISELETELLKRDEVSGNLFEQLEFAIGLCKIALDRMRELVVKEGFLDKNSEIHFFKKIKPIVYSKLLYYQAVFDIESIRQNVDRKNLKKFFQREQKKLLKFMKKNYVKVQYYRCDHNYLDEKYFTRNNEKIPLEAKDNQSLFNEDFFSCRDHTFSVIMAKEMLIKYISKEIEEIEHPEGKDQVMSKSNLSWTDSKMDAYEFIYGIYYAGSVNHGKATISDLAEAFEKMFNIELKKDIYHAPSEMVQRNEPAKYLSRLVAIIRRKMNNKLR
ncbi:hypothetical protein GM418_29905 [Maribellus comscasis]|uniref:Tetracycline regulation of excision, RteC n=1 Tax=Maribellus comscasis TaxID=2681766 RepID=A0A6I6K4W7_9BACT|nr:RteC domain-containing protein [Maribellus comscasis]QGY47727.1 hypothetical protein GM418_29905 [Maribellus comscasis]